MLLTGGCNTVYVTSRKYVNGPHYAATDPIYIAVLRKPPTRPHIRLGEIIAEPFPDSVGEESIEAALRKAAAKMGASAVVIVHDGTQVTEIHISGPWYHRSAEAVRGRVIVAVAIRYTDLAFK